MSSPCPRSLSLYHCFSRGIKQHAKDHDDPKEISCLMVGHPEDGKWMWGEWGISDGELGAVFPDRSSLPAISVALWHPLAAWAMQSNLATSEPPPGPFHPTPVTSRFMTPSPIATLVPNSQDTELTIEATIKRNSRNACVLGVKNPMVLRSGFSLVKHRKLSCKVTRDSFKLCKCGWLGGGYFKPPMWKKNVTHKSR